MIELTGGSTAFAAIGLLDRSATAREAADPAGAVPSHPARIRGFS